MTIPDVLIGGEKVEGDLYSERLCLLSAIAILFMLIKDEEVPNPILTRVLDMEKSEARDGERQSDWMEALARQSLATCRDRIPFFRM